MKILFTIAHYFKPQAGAKYGSQGKSTVTQRVHALRAAISSLHQLYGNAQAVLRISDHQALPANESLGAKIDVVVCTVGEDHLLGQIGLPVHSLLHRRTQAQPLLLGYECHAVLREAMGHYDYYCFLEDDLVLHDPLFFAKLRWFNQKTSDDNLLQPNRFEVSAMTAVNKVYIDGDIPPAATARFQNPMEQPVLNASVMGASLQFQRALNPHSGCFFLNQAQLERWVGQPYFLDRQADFVGPLESAASLGIMRTFRLYKAAPRNAAFLEIQHAGTAFLSLLGSTIRLAPELMAKLPESASTLPTHSVKAG